MRWIGCFNGFGLGGGGIMMFLWMAMLGVIIYLLVKGTVGQNSNDRASHVTHTDALEIAKKRLAKGEITIEEFESIKNTLQ